MSEEEKLKKARRAVVVLSLLLIAFLLTLLFLYSGISRSENSSELSVSAGNYIRSSGSEEIIPEDEAASAQNAAFLLFVLVAFVLAVAVMAMLFFIKQRRGRDAEK